MFFPPEITEVLRDILPWAGFLFQLITELGGELLYIGLVLIGYWAFRKREAVIAAFVLLAAILSNYWLKMAIANPRPDSVYWYEGVTADHYSTPSGHAQNAAALYGWLALKIKKSWMYVLVLLLTFLIGLSRVYLGVHYLDDVLLGWGIGFLIAVLIFRFEQPLAKFFARYREEYSFLALFLVGFGMMMVSMVIPPPPATNFGNVGGFTMGIAVGLPLERRFVGFSVEAPNGQKWRLAVRVIVGLVLVVGVMMGLTPLLPSDDLWLRAIRYFAASFIAIFVWPAIFKRANL